MLYEGVDKHSEEEGGKGTSLFNTRVRRKLVKNPRDRVKDVIGGVDGQLK